MNTTTWLIATKANVHVESNRIVRTAGSRRRNTKCKPRWARRIDGTSAAACTATPSVVPMPRNTISETS